MASRPFDVQRDGIVCGEGAGMLLLESLEHALERNAVILAELRGFATRNSTNIAQPDSKTITECMQEALDDAGLHPHDLAYINAHATSTVQGDAAEGRAIAALVAETVPVSSLKGHMGHTLGACGALESIAAVSMLQQRTWWPTLGLIEPDLRCGALCHVQQHQPQNARAHRHTAVLKNCFALGGCTSSVILDAFRL